MAETRAATAEIRAEEATDAAAEASGATKRARTPDAAAAEAQAAGATALAQLETTLLKPPWRKRAGYLDKSPASRPGALAALHGRFADLTAGPVTAVAKAAAVQTEELRAQISVARVQLQPAAPDTGAAARTTENLFAQLDAQQAETDVAMSAPLLATAAREAAALQAAEAAEAAQLAIASAASNREALPYLPCLLVP